MPIFTSVSVVIVNSLVPSHGSKWYVFWQSYLQTLRHDVLWGRGNLSLKSSTVRLRWGQPAWHLATYRFPTSLLNSGEPAKIKRLGKGKYVGGVGSEPSYYLLRYRGSQATWQVTWLLRQQLKKCCDFELSISLFVLMSLRPDFCSWFFSTWILSSCFRRGMVLYARCTVCVNVEL